MYPLDLVIARLQAQKQLRGPEEAPSAAHDLDAEYDGLLDAARKIYRHEGGVTAFYTGCLPDVAKGIADSFLFFLVYSLLHQYESRKVAAAKKQLSVPKELGIGVAAGALAKLLTTPLQNIITRQQTAALIAVRDPNITDGLKSGDRSTVAGIAKQIYKERGLQGFWAGYSASLILTLNPAITFAVDNILQRLLAKSNKEASGPLTFLIAAISKTVATTVTYPVSVAKTRAQVKSPTTLSEAEKPVKEGGSSGKTASSIRGSAQSRLHQSLRLFSAQYAIFLSLRKIYQAEGLGGLYSGLEGEVLKGFLSHGLTMVLKDRVHSGVIRLYYTLLKLTRRWPENLQIAQDAAGSVVSEAKSRAENVSVTVAEGGRNALGKVKDQS